MGEHPTTLSSFPNPQRSHCSTQSLTLEITNTKNRKDDEQESTSQLGGSSLKQTYLFCVNQYGEEQQGNQTDGRYQGHDILLLLLFFFYLIVGSIIYLATSFTQLVVHVFWVFSLFQIQTIYNSSRSNNQPSEIDVDQFR